MMTFPEYGDKSRMIDPGNILAVHNVKDYPLRVVLTLSRCSDAFS